MFHITTWTHFDHHRFPACHSLYSSREGASRLAGKDVPRMILNSTQRRLFRTFTVAHTRYQQQCGKRKLPSSFVGKKIIASPFDFSTTNYHNDSKSLRLNRFEKLNLHPLTLEALHRQGIHVQTEIQQKTHDLIIRGKNVLARSRTGSGKTLAFLVPSIERFLSQQQQFENYQGIPILILTPTRELAAQIGREAEKLLSIHRESGTNKSKRFSTQVVYGGSPKSEEIRRFQRGLPDILVATPGRLKDHL